MPPARLSTRTSLLDQTGHSPGRNQGHELGRWLRRGVLTSPSCNAAMIPARRSCVDRFPRSRVSDACGAGYDRELTPILPDRFGFALPFAASFVGLSLIAGSIGASPEPPSRCAAPAAMAPPAAPAMARPAAPALHPAPA